LVFAAYMAPSVLGAPIVGRFTSALAQRVGMITFLAGMIGIIAAISAGTLALFIIATIVAGAGQGIAISGATRGLLHGSTLADRAPIFSAIYLVCYSGATFPSLISGKLSSTFSLPQIAFGYGVIALGATLFTVLGARDPCVDTTENNTRDSSSTLDDTVAALNPTEPVSRKTIIRVRP
jgi:MFS family permease